MKRTINLFRRLHLSLVTLGVVVLMLVSSGVAADGNPRTKSTPVALKFERAAGRTVYVDFPQTLRKGSVYTIEFYYSGHPVEMGRFGGFVFKKDPMGRPLVNTACEEEGASVWWPNKDQWRDEVEGMDISVEAPSDLVEVSGRRRQRRRRRRGDPRPRGRPRSRPRLRHRPGQPWGPGAVVGLTSSA